LESIRALDYPAERIELIYADSASTDDSCGVAEGLGARVLRIPADRATAAAGRNAGWQAARNAFVHFVDGDTVMDRAWLKKAIAAMRDDAVIAVFGRVEELHPRASIYNYWAHHDWYCAPGPTHGTGGIALFRRSAVEAVDGFDDSLIAGEEPEMCHRIRKSIGGTFLALDEPMVQHDIAMTRFAQYWRRCKRTGYGYAEVVRRHPDMATWRKALIRNMAHTVAPFAFLTLSIILRSVWPMVVWMGLLLLAITRNAFRHRNRVGSIGGAWVYATHHYVSKLPAGIGQLRFWIFGPIRRKPHVAIEPSNVQQANTQQNNIAADRNA